MKKIILGCGCLVIIVIGVLGIVLITIFAVLFMDQEETEMGGGGGQYTWGGEASFADNEVPAQYIPLYQEAANEYDLDWELLAAIHRVETVFSTLDPMISHVGAEGHAQFMPCSWVGWSHPTCEGLGEGNMSESEKKDVELIEKNGGYGVDANGDGVADMWDIEDAIFSMANLLASHYKDKGTVEGAILGYNHSDKYVNDVTRFMNNYKNNFVAVDYMGNQGNNISLKGDKAWVVPNANFITSCYGSRWGKNHNGIDITAGAPGKVNGYDVVAFMDGTVSVSMYGEQGSGYGGYGNVVVLDHGNGIETLYAHLLEPGISVVRQVKAGDVIGKVGNSGASQGAHLHFEIRENGNPVNPMDYLQDFDMDVNPSGSNCEAYAF
ncbi:MULTISPECIES: peptidoglycan DD-metalloendopeptidase family protein [Oceanobacillus]|uniref:peptidoglycan DD-metalloendopeptidase family protein n=1 Tax=Oceanobacillus TaxID=182709 RepID=UPI000693F952|nr:MULTISPECIES: peptidoglycan DD-metalloendopeptidase family protein [Oceanobacillus]